MDAQKLVSELSGSLLEGGVDVVFPLRLSWYNNVIPPELAARIRPAGTAGYRALVVLIGNSKLVWEPFLAACSRNPALLASEHPFNLYVEGALEAALKRAGAHRLTHRIYWSHKRTAELESAPDGQGPPRFVAMQRMADAAGLAYLDHDSHLSLHPKFGPWFSLRAAVVFDDQAWDAPRPRALRNPMCPTTQHYVRLAMETAIHCAERRVHRAEEEVRRASCDGGSAAGACEGRRGCSGSDERRRRSSEAWAGGPAAAARPAGDGGQQSTAASRLQAAACCELECGAAGARACSPRAVAGSESWGCSRAGSAQQEGEGDGYDFAVHDNVVAPPPSRPSMDAVRSTWKKWVAVRDAPCPGHPWRYCEEQIAYHYTADRGVLLKALERRGL